MAEIGAADRRKDSEAERQQLDLPREKTFRGLRRQGLQACIFFAASLILVLPWGQLLNSLPLGQNRPPFCLPFQRPPPGTFRLL